MIGMIGWSFAMKHGSEIVNDAAVAKFRIATSNTPNTNMEWRAGE